MRTDLATSEWHKLIKPVLPHASTDKDDPQHTVVRIEAEHGALYAVASDGTTLAAERHRAFAAAAAPPVHVRATEAAASLKLFPFSKDEDPILNLVIDTVPVPVDVAGERRSVNHLALTLQRGDGTRLAMHDRRDPSRDPLARWRKTLLATMTRGTGRPLNGIDLRGATLARWKDAARGGERVTLYTGPEPGDPLLVTVEDHFAGIWTIPRFLDAPGKRLAESPWLAELTLDSFDLRTATGVRTVSVDTSSGEVLDDDGEADDGEQDGED